MDLTVAKKDLLRLVKRAAAVADKKNTMPVLACALLEATPDGLAVKATDLHLSVHGSCAAEVRRKGSVAVDAKGLLERVNAMPDGPVLVRVDESSMTLKAAGSARRYTIKAVPGSEYPVLPEVPAEAQRLTLSAERLLRLLNATVHAVSVDDTRPNLNSLLVKWDASTMRAVATDGHRLTMLEVDPVVQGEGSMLIPLKGVLELRRLAEDARSSESAVVTVIAAERDVCLEAAGALFSCKLVEATFPSYGKVIPDAKGRHTATVPRAALLDAVKAVKLAANDRTGGIRLAFEAGKLLVLSESPDRGDGADEVPADYAGPGLQIGVNAKYIEDVLGVLDTTDVVLAHGGELDPLTLAPGGDERLTSVVMPMRL